MKRNFLVLIPVTLFIGMLVLGVVSKIQAQPGCSLASLNGSYGFSGIEFVQGTGAAAATVASRPAGTLTIFTFDGVGGVSVEFSTQSHNGTIFFLPIPPTFTATYAVNPNCTGSFATSAGETGSFVIAAERRELLITETTNPFFPGPVGSGSIVGIRMDNRKCSVASLNGSYGVGGSGFFQGTGASAATLASRPAAAVGIVSFDGAGGVSVELTANDNGTVKSITDTGTYAVNSNCTGSISVPSALGDFVIVAEGKKVLVISTAPGDVKTFVLIRIR